MQLPAIRHGRGNLPECAARSWTRRALYFVPGYMECTVEGSHSETVDQGPLQGRLQLRSWPHSDSDESNLTAPFVINRSTFSGAAFARRSCFSLAAATRW
jgi:hypothetical protein